MKSIYKMRYGVFVCLCVAYALSLKIDKIIYHKIIQTDRHTGKGSQSEFVKIVKHVSDTNMYSLQ